MKTPFKILFLAVGCWLLAFAASAQVDVTKRGITPPHNIKNHDYTQSASKFGQMLGVKKFGTSAGDTLVGFLPVYYLGDSTLKVGAYTVVHSGNVTTYAPGTDLSYTASSRLLASSTGNDVTLPLFTSTEAGLVPLSGGGTSNFLRADGTWAAPVGSVTSVGLSMPTGFSVSGSPVTSSGTLAVSTTLNGPLRGNGSGFTTGNIALGSEVSGTLPIANGGTNITTYTTGDILFASATNTLSKLAGVATGNALLSGGVGVAPAWGKIGLTTHVSGTLEVSNGGTGAGAFTKGSIVFAGVSGVYNQDNANLFYNSSSKSLFIGKVSGMGYGIELRKDGSDQGIIIEAGGSNSGFAPLQWNRRYRGTFASPNETIDNDIIYAQIFSGVNGSLSFSQAARITVLQDGAATSTQVPGKIQFSVNNGTASIIPLTILSSGNIGVSTLVPTEKLHVTGNVLLTGVIKNADGTASLPSYSFTNDLDVGLYRPTTNVLGFTVGGTEEMRLLTTGLNIGTAGSNQGNLLLNGSTSGTVTVTTAAAAGTWTMTLPTGAGSSGQVLQTNGSGVTSWATVSASPGGSTTHVQYNNAGSFGGSANFTFNGTNVSLANPIYYATGSSAAPSISFTGDTNMGIYRAAADDLAIVAGGADIVRVNANGVGIGVVPSIYTLDITSTNAARIPGGTTAQRPTAAARLLRYNSDNETIEWNNGTTWYQAVTGTGSASRVAVWTGGLNLTNDAELGYNTTTNVLSVGGKIENAAGSAGAPTYTFSGDNTMGMYGSSGTLNWSTSGTLRMTMNTDGTTKLTSTGSATNSTINTLYYNKSSSAVDDDYLTLAYNLDDSGGNETTFGQIRIISENVTNGSEGGQFAFLAQKAGTLTQLATLDATSFSLNNLTPFKTGQFTATQASAISPQNGMLIYVTSTNATFTSVGHWARENGVWVKL